MPEPLADMVGTVLASLGGGGGPVAVTGSGRLPSVYRVTDLAVASVGAAGSALSALLAGATGGAGPEVRVDRALASRWFASSLVPVGWEIPPAWDPVAGDYRGADGWIRLHTNAERHRAAALRVLGVGPERSAVAERVARWPIEELEAAVVEAGGAAAAMRTAEAWAAHPQGGAVAVEPLLHAELTAATDLWWRPGVGTPEPLAGLRVLDMTRVLAGPVATRLLAGWGAEVLRVDPPGWDEPAVEPEVTLGKRCCRLDLRRAEERHVWEGLLAGADVLVHGYRPGALEALGVGVEARDRLRPGLVEVSLDAYGWSGPWRTRRGFDSLVQMSAGIAAAGQAATGADRPVPLPVQALDHATGYLMAAAVLAGLREREASGRGSRWRASLARTAGLLVDHGQVEPLAEPLEPAGTAGEATSEATPWGPARRLPPPLEVSAAPLRWRLPARPLGTDAPCWAAGGA